MVSPSVPGLSDAAESPDHLKSMRPAPRRGKTGGAGPTHPLRVLIIDDDERTRRALSAYLGGTRALHIVGEAADGQAAARRLAVLRPDVILMNCCASPMSSIEAALMLKSRWPRVKLVLLILDPVYELDSRLAGADAVLINGCSGDALTRTIVSVAAAT